MAKRKKRGAAPRPGPTETERIILRAKKEATDEAVRLTVTLMLTVLLDKFNAREHIRRSTMHGISWRRRSWRAG